jgi:hypothetical protein
LKYRRTMTSPSLFVLSTLLLASSAHGFQGIMVPPSTIGRPAVTGINMASDASNNAENNNHGWAYPPQFHRAVECVKTQGLCHVDELLALADELEQYEDSCLWQVPMNSDGTDAPDNDCETEFLDRLDIADLLRAEAEMIQRRENALEFSNLFREKIEKDEDQESQPQPPKEVIDLYSNFYECVYSRVGCGP